MTLEQLTAIMPRLQANRALEYLPLLNAAMVKRRIDTPLRQAAFLAQVAHESCELRFWEELGTGAAYEGKAYLGNTTPGDGARYKGRGPLQLTGKDNYTRFGRLLGKPLAEHPELVAQPDVGFEVAALYWQLRGLNEMADRAKNDSLAFDRITFRINGGYNGKAKRDAYYARAQKALGITG